MQLRGAIFCFGCLDSIKNARLGDPDVSVHVITRPTLATLEMCQAAPWLAWVVVAVYPKLDVPRWVCLALELVEDILWELTSLDKGDNLIKEDIAEDDMVLVMVGIKGKSADIREIHDVGIDLVIVPISRDCALLCASQHPLTAREHDIPGPFVRQGLHHNGHANWPAKHEVVLGDHDVAPFRTELPRGNGDGVAKAVMFVQLKYRDEVQFAAQHFLVLPVVFGDIQPNVSTLVLPPSLPWFFVPVANHHNRQAPDMLQHALNSVADHLELNLRGQHGWGCGHNACAVKGW